jgi:hypothetical protein
MVELVNEGDDYRIEPLDAVAAQSRFENYVSFLKQRKNKNGTTTSEPTIITEAIAKQYLKSQACQNNLPKLSSILRCPLLVERNKQLHRLGQGHDQITGFFVASKEPPQAVTLAEAVEYLSNLLYDFDFVTPGDRSRAIASLLTPALKLSGLIRESVPVDVAEANASQSGKTYRQRMIAALYNDKPAVVTKKAGGVGSIEETFSDHLVNGKVFIQFDNVRGKLDSQFLESFLTAEGTFPARIPYHGTVKVDPAKHIIFISSNGFEATKDLANRACIVRIRRRDNHHFRMHEGKDVLQMMFELHSVLIGAVFTVIEEWYKQGKPRTKETRHDFREWCQTLDWIVQNIFKEAPLMDGHQEAKERAASPQLTWLREVAIKLNQQRKLDQRITAATIADLCLEEEIVVPGLPADKRTREEAQKQIGRIFGKLFGDNTELTIDAYKVVKRETTGKTESGNDQKLKNYTFSLLKDSKVPVGPIIPEAPTVSTDQPESGAKIQIMEPPRPPADLDPDVPPHPPLPKLTFHSRDAKKAEKSHTKP